MTLENSRVIFNLMPSPTGVYLPNSVAAASNGISISVENRRKKCLLPLATRLPRSFEAIECDMGGSNL